MKMLIGILMLASVVSNAATFTFHAVKESWTEISVNMQPLPCNPERGCQSYVIGYWDYGFDIAFPADAYSGLTSEQVDCACNFSPWLNASGYQDTLSFTVPDSVAEVDVWISGGYPDYLNGQVNFDLQDPNGGVALRDGGEAWIDFSPTGIGRISLTKPTDFGKWAWDGSINPSWTAAKKGFAKGHNKQPLPSPK